MFIMTVVTELPIGMFKFQVYFPLKTLEILHCAPLGKWKIDNILEMQITE